MCLGVPMRVVEVGAFRARCEARGVERDVILSMLPEPVAQDDYVLVHLGFAVQKLDREQAEQAWSFLDELMADGPAEAPDA